MYMSDNVFYLHISETFMEYYNCNSIQSYFLRPIDLNIKIDNKEISFEKLESWIVKVNFINMMIISLTPVIYNAQTHDPWNVVYYHHVAAARLYLIFKTTEPRLEKL